MSRVVGTLLVIAATLGSGYFFMHYRIEGLGGLSIKPRVADSATPDGQAAQRQPPASAGSEAPGQPPATENSRRSIRIATINLGPLDQRKLDDRPVAGRLAQLVRRYDVVAIQDIRARNRGLLIEFTDLINSKDRNYDYAAPPELEHQLMERYSAFLFDGSAIQIDRNQVYSVADPGGKLSSRPLVASFRVRGPKTTEAFTFTLINVHVDPRRAAEEVEILADVFRQVRDNGSGEDDVILLGQIGTDDQHLGRLAEVPNMTWVISAISTTTRGTRLVDNLFFDSRATTEFTSRSGMLDLMQEFDLSMHDADKISAHLPVWAEFSVYEGGQPERLAGEHIPPTR